jgi:hypothetical protein
MKISGQQWEDSIRRRFYPFDTANPPVSRRGIVLPEGFIEDAVVFLSSAEAGARLDSVEVTSTPDVILTFTDDAGAPAGTAVLPPTAGAGRYPLVLGGITTGYVRIGEAPTAVVRSWFPSTYVFAAPLLPHLVVVSSPDWVPGIVLPGGTTLTGDVYLVGGEGVVLVRDGDDIRVDVLGDPYAGREAPQRALRSLGGTLPLPGGDIAVVPVPGTPAAPFRVRVVPLGGGRIRVELQG